MGNLGGNANVQQAHGGAAVVENLDTGTQSFEVQVKFSYFHPTLSDPVYKPQKSECDT